MQTLSLQQFIELAKSQQRVAVFQEIAGDSITPISVYYALKEHMKGATLQASLSRCANTWFGFKVCCPRRTVASFAIYGSPGL